MMKGELTDGNDRELLLRCTGGTRCSFNCKGCSLLERENGCRRAAVEKWKSLMYSGCHHRSPTSAALAQTSVQSPTYQVCSVQSTILNHHITGNGTTSRPINPPLKFCNAVRWKSVSNIHTVPPSSVICCCCVSQRQHVTKAAQLPGHVCSETIKSEYGRSSDALKPEADALLGVVAAAGATPLCTLEALDIAIPIAGAAGAAAAHVLRLQRRLQ